MSLIKISALPSASVPTDNDIIPIVDYETLTTTALKAAYLAAYISSSINVLNSLTIKNNFTVSGNTILGNGSTNQVRFNATTWTLPFNTTVSTNDQFILFQNTSSFPGARFQNTNQAGEGGVTILNDLGLNAGGQFKIYGSSYAGTFLGSATNNYAAFNVFGSSVAGLKIGADLNIPIVIGNKASTDPSGVERFKVSTSGEVIVNPTSASLTDFRVNGQTEYATLFVDVSQNNVGIGTGAPNPAYKLDVRGGINVANEVVGNSNITNSLTASILSGGNGNTLRIDAAVYGYSSAYTNLTGNYVLTNGDNGKVISINAASQATVTIPLNLTGGFGVSLFQIGAGPLFVTGVIGVTTFNRQSQFRTAGQYAIASLIYISGNAYIFGGDTQL